MLRRVLDSPWTYFILAGLLVVVALASQFRFHLPGRPSGSVDDLLALRESRPNVVFVVIDTLRADRLSAYGYERPTSPVLADLARAGVRFARVEAQSSWTKTSMASLWTGRFPSRTGVLRFKHALPLEATLPAELFEQAGYVTAGIGRNSWLGANFGFGQGFDSYLMAVPDAARAEFQAQNRAPGGMHLRGSDEDVTRAAIGFLEANAREPFMLYVHYMDVHQYAYDQEAAALGFGTALADHYDSAIHWVDRNVAAVLTHLERSGLFEKTIVVIASDHGEELLEHGGEGHAKSLHREVTDVPWLIALPFRLKQGIVVDSLARNVDIWPTLLDLAGLPPLPDADGRSLVPAIVAAARGEPSGEAPPAYGYLDRNWGQADQEPAPILSVREGDRRLVLRTAPERELLLFDVAADPTEQRNLVGQRDDWVQELLPGLERSLDAPVAWAVPEVELDEMSREVLRALGYVVK